MKTNRKRMTRTSRWPRLQFSPTAWSKLLFLRDYGDTEVGGFGISRRDDLLAIEDVQLVKQSCTVVSVAFQDESVADFFDAQVDRGLKPEQFARVWVHTHPGDSAQPSMTDEETFARVFGRSDWALMFILACGGQTYARLRFNVGPGGELEIPVDVDFDQPFGGSDHEAWEAEYLAHVQARTQTNHRPQGLRNVLDAAGVFDLRDEELVPAGRHVAAGLMAEESDLLLSEILGDDPNGWDLWEQFLKNEQGEDFP